jgi:predicted DNA-binding WGR domain protein
MVDLTTKVNKGDKIYLVHQSKNKFWQVCNEGQVNKIKYGKWNKGFETKVIQGDRVYEDLNSALARALSLVTIKTGKGYELLKKENPEKNKINNTFTSMIQLSIKGNKEKNIEIEL